MNLKVRLAAVVVGLVAGVGCSGGSPATVPTTNLPRYDATAAPECFMSAGQLKDLQAQAGARGVDSLTAELDRQAAALKSC